MVGMLIKINFTFKKLIFLKIFLLIPKALTAKRELDIDFHEFEEKNTSPGQELPASQKRTSYRENMKSQFNMAAVCSRVYIGSQIEILGYNCQ